MNKKISKCLFIIYFSLLISDGKAASTESCLNFSSSQSSGTTSKLYSISAVSESIVWAAGIVSTVKRTTDGGFNWVNANPGSYIFEGNEIHNIFAMDDSTAFVTSSSTAATFIYMTSNGGINWRQVFTQPGGFINAIKMVSPLEGYAQGDPVGGKWTILHTIDGGETWLRMATEPIPSGGVEAGWSNSMSIVGTYIWFGTNNSKIWRSSNLGLTWSAVPTPGTLNTYGIHFNDTLKGVAGGSAGMYSTDAGLSWNNTMLPGFGSINSISGVNNDIWVVRATNIYRSTNNGINWIAQPQYTGAANLNDLDFHINLFGCSMGWAVGNEGQIILSGPIIDVITNTGGNIPSSYFLKQNFPNPFNPVTKINFDLPFNSKVMIKVFDISGREVATLVNDIHEAGFYSVTFDAKDLASGAYFYQIIAESATDGEKQQYVITKKMVLIR